MPSLVKEPAVPIFETFTPTAALLRAAAEFDDAEWGQGINAADRHARPVDPGAPTAVQFCAQGLILREIRRRPELYYSRIFPALTAGLPAECRHLPGWNDAPGRTPQEVRELFRTTAARLEAQARTAEPEPPRGPDVYPRAFAYPPAAD